jgi:hypothetical protein
MMDVLRLVGAGLGFGAVKDGTEEALLEGKTLAGDAAIDRAEVGEETVTSDGDLMNAVDILRSAFLACNLLLTSTSSASMAASASASRCSEADNDTAFAFDSALAASLDDVVLE